MGISWSSLKFHKDPEITLLISSLPSVLLADTAQSTVRKYFYAFKKWGNWAKRKGFTPVPANPKVFVLYLVHLLNTSSTKSSFDSVIHGVSWAHKKSGLNSPANSLTAKQVINAGHIILGLAPTNCKLPLEKHHLRLLFDKFAFATLDKIQILTLISLGFTGFLRWNDLSRIKLCDISFHESFVAIFLEQRKNDQYREGSWVYISKSYSKYCPVLLLKRFLAYGKHSQNSFLFRKIAHTNKGAFLRSQKLSYSRALELVRLLLKGIGLDAQKYGLHGMRSGGASLAAAPGVPDRLIIRQGGWKLVSSKNRYIKESLPSLLSVSRMFKL